MVVSASEARQSIINRERKELEDKWSDDKDAPESVFILEALKREFIYLFYYILSFIFQLLSLFLDIETRDAQLFDREEIESAIPVKLEQRRSVSPKEKSPPSVTKPISTEVGSL